MTRTIQKPNTLVRRAFLEHAAALYGTVLSPAELDAADDCLDDLTALALVFPDLGDAERHEALWALGRFIE